MRKSLKLADNEITDPKFYYQLGHGLTTLGKKSEADAVYQKAAQMGVFMTAQQRSLYNIEGLTARAWWNMDQTPYSKFLKTVERQWATIRQEGMEVLRDCNDCWLDHNQQLVIDGQWKFFPLMAEQNFIKASCERMPQTCLILQEFSSSSNASKSEMYLSVLSSGASILPHCGPTNYHLQAHLGLVSPSEARIRVGNETKGWRSGKFIIFDESFEHEVMSIVEEMLSILTISASIRRRIIIIFPFSSCSPTLAPRSTTTSTRSFIPLITLPIILIIVY